MRAASLFVFIALTALTKAETAVRREPAMPVPRDAGIDERRADLGRKLFYDKRLSLENNTSCADCHPLSRGGMDGLTVPKRPNGRLHRRNTPTIFNAALNSTLNWDGIATSLENHTERIIPSLMDLPWNELEMRLKRDRTYMRAFQSIYGNGVTRQNILNAMAEFEASLLTPGSRFDSYLLGDDHALTDNELKGYELFKTYGCATCHQGVNLGGNLFQKFGVFQAVNRDRGPIDHGRGRITKVARDDRVFRVPSLRNVSVTAPYFHDGRTRTLHKAIEIMAKAQLGRELTAQEVKQIEAFLRTLTGKYQGRWVQSKEPQ